MAAQLQFCDVTLGYDRHPAVHHLNGEVAPGALQYGRQAPPKQVSPAEQPALASELAPGPSPAPPPANTMSPTQVLQNLMLPTGTP